MPLQKSITFESGLNIPNAYFVIQSINFKYQDVNTVEVALGIFVSSKDYGENKPEVDRIRHSCSGISFDTYFADDVLNQSDINPLDQAYQYLLSLPQYSDATLV